MDRSATLPYSLDYINRPNPIEPQSDAHRHPLNRPSQLSNSSNEGLRRLLVPERQPSTNGGLSKRRKPTAGRNDADDLSTGSLDLPGIPVRTGTKRMRIPPTLSGLHQPPPDARILPSISVEQPADARAAGAAEPVVPTSSSEVATEDPQYLRQRITPRIPKTIRRAWSDDETVDLLKGVAQHGVGNWTKILESPEYDFDRRTALDLRDRFRVCRPMDYKVNYKQAPLKRRGKVSARGSNSEDAPKITKNARKSVSELRAIGIEQPFVKVSRRTRTAYTPFEDRALLEGFAIYGSTWAAILEDAKDIFRPQRTATDLRDRFRTRYPEEYAKIGLAPRPEVFPPPPQRKARTRTPDLNTEMPNQVSSVQATSTTAPAFDPFPLGDPYPPLATRSQPNSNHPYNDVFFGAPLGSAFDDNEPVDQSIVLDRGILDWANEPLPTALPADYSGRMDIDPQATMRPWNDTQTFPANTYPAGNGSGSTYMNGEILPSLAAITADGMDGLQSEHLELPSLMLEAGVDGRGAGHIMNIEDMLG
nr:telomere-associated protein 1 [Quercus suber]